MLLCQVAPGVSQKVNSRDQDLHKPLDLTEYQSRKANGSEIPAPRYTITRNDGPFSIYRCVFLFNIL